MKPEALEALEKQAAISVKDHIFVFTGFRSIPLERAIVKGGGSVAKSLIKAVTAVVKADGDTRITGKAQAAVDRGLPLVLRSVMEAQLLPAAAVAVE